MAGQQVEVPSFEFSAFLYADILESLILFKRQNAPELTDESEFEPLIQLLRAFALVGHLNNVLIDVIANESTLPTAKLPETVRNMLRLINYELRPASPAQVDMLYKLSTVFTVTTEVVPEDGQVATRRQVGDVPVIFFEANEAVSVPRTDMWGAVRVDNGGSFEDNTASANSGASWTWTPLAFNDAVYFGHAEAMWNEMDVAGVSSGDISIGVWEFFDNDFNDTVPDLVTDLGSGVLRFNLNGLLGTQKRSGATVRVTFNETQVFEDGVSGWDGSNNFVAVGLLGQTSISFDESDYSVGVQWQEMDDVDDETTNLGQDGLVSFTLPQNETRKWEKTTIDGFEGFFIRFRVVETAGTGAPTIGRVRLDTGDQYVTAPATQGRSEFAEVLGSSNGTPDQRFTASRSFFILNSQTVRVDATEWTPVTNFLNSGPQDEHYVVELGEDDTVTFVFGNGSNGKIPPIGQGNIDADYRWNAEEDGNVGARTITVDKQGLTFVDSVTNPRPAAGWAESQATDEDSLEEAKIEGPAQLRIIETALSPDDVVDLALNFVDSNGSSPVSRAFVIEEGFGPKTMKLVVLGAGGTLLTTTQLTELDTYFNGDKTAVPPQRKRVVANQEVTSVNFTPRTIDVDAIVEIPANSGITVTQITNQLTAILQPEARNTDGVTYIWQFGGKVPTSRLTHEVFEVDERIGDVDITTPPSDVTLGPQELPVPGTFNITLVET